MNRYESVVVINPSLDEQGVKAFITKFSDMINNNGKLNEVEELGKRKLAYEIKKCTEGYYIVFNFYAETEFLEELERVYRITDEVLKFIIVKDRD